MPPTRYYSAVVTDTEDPDELGRLRVVSGELYGDGETEFPAWIPPRVQAASALSSGWWFVPPVDSVVVLEQDAAGVLRWLPAPWGQVNAPPAFLTANYPRRAGFTAPEGAHALALDDDVGLLVLVTDPADPEGVANYLSLNGEDGEAKIGLISGSLFMLSETQALAMNAAGDVLVLDSANGVTLAHQDGAELLSLSSGVAMLSGGDVQVVGGGVTVTGQGGITLTSDTLGLAPTEPLVLGTSFLTDLATFLTGCVGDAAMSPGVAAAAGVLLATVNTSLAAGAPYLSTVTTTE